MVYCQARRPSRARGLRFLVSTIGGFSYNMTIANPVTRRFSPARILAPALLRQWLLRATRSSCTCPAPGDSVLAGLHGVVPAYIASQAGAIAASAAHQGVPPSWLAAVFYNEILGTEDAVLQEILPGDNEPLSAVRQVLLGTPLLHTEAGAMAGQNGHGLAWGRPYRGPRRHPGQRR